MRKFIVVLFFCAWLLGCVSLSQEPTPKPVERLLENSSILWSEERDGGIYHIELSHEKVAFVSSRKKNGRLFQGRPKERPTETPVILFQEITIPTDEPKVEHVYAIVILDETLATKTTDVQLVVRDNRMKTVANESGHGALLFFDLTPIPILPENIDENGDVTSTVPDSLGEIGGSIIACYRLLDENGTAVYEQLQGYVFEYVSMDEVPNCQGIRGE